MTETIRLATPADDAAIVALWHEGWHDAHARLVPADVLAYRTPAYFRVWRAAMENPLYVLDDGTVQGFVVGDGAEMEKLYVAQAARGTGIATQLLSFAEAHLRDCGVRQAHLHCTLGNDRAQRFYARSGWIAGPIFEDDLWFPPGVAGSGRVKTLKMIKDLARADR